METAQDQRRYPRSDFRRPICVLCKGKTYFVVGVDLGEGGLSFISDLVFPVDTLLVLTFRIPNGSFVSMRAQVVRVGKPEKHMAVHGCAFLNIKFESKREIRAFVSNRKPEAKATA